MSLSSTDGRRLNTLRVLRRRAWIVVLLGVLAGAAAYVAAQAQAKTYTATASLLFQPQQLGQQVFGYAVSGQISDPGVVQATDVELAAAPAVAIATAAHLGMSAADVSHSIAVTPAGSSQVVSITATTATPAQAARLANAYAQGVVNSRRSAQQQLVFQATQQVRDQLTRLLQSSPHSPQVRQYQSHLSQLAVLAALQTGDVQIANPATAPQVPSGPSVRRDTGLGLLLGVIIGLAVAFLLERADRRLRDADELAALYGLTVLAQVPRSKSLLTRSSAERPPVTDHATAEAFRLLRARLRYFNVDRKLQLLLVTSAVPREGKSTVAWQLAWTAAMTAPDEPVLLIDADLRRPSISAIAGLSPAPGLSDALTQLDDWREAVQTIDTGPVDAGVLQVITAGGPPPNPTELIESDRFRTLLAEARSEYSLVIIDAPPAQIVSDALALVGQVDGAIVVGRLNHTHRDAVIGLRTTLTEMNAPVLGLVVNFVTGPSGRYGSGYGYGYGSYGEADAKAPRPPSRSLSSQ